MKKHFIIALVMTLACVAVVLSVSLQFIAIDKLLRPPKQEGENLIIQQTFEKNVSEDYVLKIASSDEYSTAYNFVDIDADETEEVVVTYCDSDAVDDIKLCVLDKVDGEWHFVTELTTDYNKIDLIEFL